MNMNMTSICQSGSTSKYVKISDDLTIHYKWVGKGSTVLVLVPGWTMTTECFEPQLSYFADSDRISVLTYDPRAQGLSSITMDGHHYQQHGQDLKALLDALSIEQFVLAGWSSGGADILEYLRLFGSSGLKGFILIDSWPKARAHDVNTDWVPFGTKDNGDQDDFLKAFVLDILTDRETATRGAAEWMLSKPVNEDLAELIIRMSRRTPDSIAALLNASYWFLDNTADLESIEGQVPLLYYTREDQGNLAMQWAQKHTPSAEIISHGSHMMFYEESDLFNTNLELFVKNVT